MKDVIKFVAAFLLTLAVMIGCAAADARAELYADAHLVQFVNHDGTIVSCSDINSSEINVHLEDDSGAYFDLFPGDIIAILWDDCGTEDIYDDEIISIRYVGYLY